MDRRTAICLGQTRGVHMVFSMFCEETEPEQSEQLVASCGREMKMSNNLLPEVLEEPSMVLVAETPAAPTVPTVPTDMLVSEVKEIGPTEQLEPETSETEPSIPAAQPDWLGTDGAFCDGMNTSGTSRLSQSLDEGFRAGLSLLHTAELQRACSERGLAATGGKRELLNSLLLFFSCAPLPTPTQEAGTLHCEDRRVPLPDCAAQSLEIPASKAKANKPAAVSRAQVQPEEETPAQCGGTNVKDVQPPRVLAEEVEQLRPLKPVQRKLHLQASLLRRDRVAKAAPTPNFTALWRTMCASQPKHQSEQPVKDDIGQGARGRWRRCIFLQQM